MITFVGAARNIGNIALLATSANRPLSILQLDYIAQRKLEEAVVGGLHHHVHLAGRRPGGPPVRAPQQRRLKEPA